MLFQGCLPRSGSARAPAGSRCQGLAARKPSLLGTASRACLPAATMSGCSRRCKLGFVKFAQTVLKLITGTLSKGRKPGRPGPSFSGWWASGWWGRLGVAVVVCVGPEEAQRGRGLGCGVADRLGPGLGRRAPGQGAQLALVVWNFGNGLGGVRRIGYSRAERESPFAGLWKPLAVTGV